MTLNWVVIWNVLNKIAIVATIVGMPLTIWGIYDFLYRSTVVYDMYRESNDDGGFTVFIGRFSRRDRRLGKKENPTRQYHKNGLDADNSVNWI